MIPNRFDENVTIISGTANHLNNPLTKPNGPSQRTKERHVKVCTNSKVSHVNRNTVLANDNASLADGYSTYINGSVIRAEGENALANGTAINGNARMDNGQPAPESVPGSSSENAESSHW